MCQGNNHLRKFEVPRSCLLLVSTYPFFAVLGANIVCDPDRLSIVFALADR